MIRLLNIFFILLIFNGCAWIEREYYYKSNNNQADWNYMFIKEKGYIKHGIHGSREELAYVYDNLYLFKLHINYLDMVAYGPVLIPFIPTLWDTDKNLTINVQIYPTGKRMTLDPKKWKIQNTKTKTVYFPSSIDIYSNKTHKSIDIASEGPLQIDDQSYLYISYPIKVVDIDDIEIDISPFNYDKELLTPSLLKLKKIKGEWYSNGWTV